MSGGGPGPGTRMLLNCDLCIVGAGYAGLNAYNAAAKYLPNGARVIVIDRGARWGGQWPETYGFVRLHQPHRMFTAGERRWSIHKPEAHLATKGEILNHFDDIVSMATSERDLELVELFRYQYEAPFRIEGDRVCLTALPLEGGAPAIEVNAARMIDASGFDVAVKRPLTFSAPPSRVHSLAPADLLSPRWTALMRYSADADKPIWVLGSGKTAMDAINHLAKHASTRRRLFCVAGRGSWFLNRECLFPMDWWEMHRPSLRTSTDHFIDMMELYDGKNEAEVYAAAERAGALHSPLDAPTSFSFGMCSTAEVENVRATLQPKVERVVRAHLVDVMPSDSDESVLLHLQPTDGDESGRFVREIPAGSFIVNCTDNLAPIDKVHPIIDESGLVCAPQALCCFSGPSADHVVHAWYLGTLGNMWKVMPRISFSLRDKHKALVAANKHNPNRYPMYRVLPTGMRLKRLFPALLAKVQKFMPLRYTDAALTDEERAQNAAKGVLGGNAGIAARL